eukprot:5739769-Prymnesium_polylepis.1
MPALRCHAALTARPVAVRSQGQTTYPHVVMQLPKDQPFEAEVNLADDELQARAARAPHMPPHDPT